jgi:hypothetical protein
LKSVAINTNAPSQVVDELTDLNVFYNSRGTMGNTKKQDEILKSAVANPNLSKQRRKELIFDPRTPPALFQYMLFSHKDLTEEEILHVHEIDKGLGFEDQKNLPANLRQQYLNTDDPQRIFRLLNREDLKPEERKSLENKLPPDPVLKGIKKEAQLKDPHSSYSEFLALLNEEGTRVSDGFFDNPVPGVTDDPIKSFLFESFKYGFDDYLPENATALKSFDHDLRAWALAHLGETLPIKRTNKQNENVKALIDFAKRLSQPAEMTSVQTYNTIGDTVGGIDFNARNLKLRIKEDGHGVPLPLNEQDPSMINAKGFIPVILQIKTPDWPLLSTML